MEFQGLLGIGKVGIAAQIDTFYGKLFLTHPLKQLQPASLWHLDIRKQNVDLPGAQYVLGLLDVIGHIHTVDIPPLPLHTFHNFFHYIFIIIHDTDVHIILSASSTKTSLPPCSAIYLQCSCAPFKSFCITQAFASVYRLITLCSSVPFLQRLFPLSLR